MAWISIHDAAAKMRDDLIEAQRRIAAGEPFNTTAAEIGFTPDELRELLDAQHTQERELRELLDAQQTQERERAFKDKWRAIYDNDQQDLY